MKLNLSCYEDFPVLKTERLTLRKIEPQDAERIFEMRSNTRTNQFIFRPNMKDVEKASELIELVEEGYLKQQNLAWAGLLRDQKKIIGTCGFNSIDHQNLRAEIGGELFIDFWGKHIAFEAVKAIIDYGFEKMLLNSIEAKVNPSNRGAIYLLEQLGFVREAYFREYGYRNGAFQDLAVYSKLKRDHDTG